jgi:hypothetical protein
MFERFQVYRFALEYPKGCVITFGKKSLRSRGYLIMELAGTLRILVSWGQLDSIIDRYPTTEAHAKHSFSKLEKAGDLKEIRLINTSTVRVNGHKATLTQFAVTSAYPVFGKYRNRETRSLHVHCQESNRFFILNLSMRADAQSPETTSAFERLKQTFLCHQVP